MSGRWRRSTLLSSRTFSGTGANFRLRLLHHIALAEMVLQPVDPIVRAQVDRFAYELSLDPGCLDAIRADEPSTALLVEADCVRNQYLRRLETQGALRTSTVGPLGNVDLERAWTQPTVERGLAERGATLADLPRGSLGRKVSEMYSARGFLLTSEHSTRRRRRGRLRKPVRRVGAGMI